VSDGAIGSAELGGTFAAGGVAASDGAAMSSTGISIGSSEIQALCGDRANQINNPACSANDAAKPTKSAGVHGFAARSDPTLAPTPNAGALDPDSTTPVHRGKRSIEGLGGSDFNACTRRVPTYLDSECRLHPDIDRPRLGGTQ